MNRNLLDAPVHPSKSISDAVRGDKTVIDLTVGLADVDPPRRLLTEIRGFFSEQRPPARDLHRYADSRGDERLRSEIVRRYRKRYGIDVDVDREVLVTNGAAEAIWLAIFALTQPGDEVMIPDPGYMLYGPATLALGRRPVPYACPARLGFRPDVDELDRLVGDRTRLMILNSPANPTGAVLTRDELLSLTHLATERGVFVLHDEVFDDTVFDGEHVPARSSWTDESLVLLANSVSKRFALTGWRVGWLVGPKSVIAEATKALSLSSLACPSITQRAVSASMADPATDAHVDANREVVRKRVEMTYTALRTIDGFETCTMPTAAFYLFVSASTVSGRLPSAYRGLDSGQALADYLLGRAHVAVVPGSGFGVRGKGHIRLCAARQPDLLTDAIERIRRVLR